MHVVGEHLRIENVIHAYKYTVTVLCCHCLFGYVLIVSDLMFGEARLYPLDWAG